MNLNDPVLTAKELLEYRRSTGGLQAFPPPRVVIFAPQKSLASYVLRKYSVRQVKGFLGGFYLLKKFNGEVALSTGFGIGAPVIAGLTDEFSALGVKQFGLVGMAGGLQGHLSAGSLVLSAGAIRGEGVSRHYLPEAEVVESSAEILLGIGHSLQAQGHLFSSGLTWTTDAPFREIRRDVLAYQDRGVLAVDMESAAMLAVAASYGLPAFAAFSIADTLANGVWQMSKDLRSAQSGLAILFEAALQHLKSA